MEKLVDIIIPFYNSSDTIASCLDSVVMQTAIDNIKVTIVDDASKEDVNKAVKKYKNKLDINFLRLDKNCGSGYARTYALNNTNCKYIFFLDADDEILGINSIELFLNKMESGYDYVYSATYYEKYEKNQINHNDLHGKFYRREFLDKYSIRFNNTRFHEDNSFNNIVKLLSKNSSCLRYVTYKYSWGKTSITFVNNDKEFERLEQFIINLKYVLDMTKDKCNKLKRMYYYYTHVSYFNSFYLDSDRKKILCDWLNKYEIPREYYLDKLVDRK